MSNGVVGCAHGYSTVESGVVGADTTVGRFVILAKDSRVGSGCRIGDHVSIQADVVIGEKVIIGAGSSIGPSTVLKDNVIVGSNVSIGMESPEADVVGGSSVPTVLGPAVQVGVGATLLGGIIVGRNAVIEPGSVVNRHVPANAIVGGNPAIVRGYAGVDKRTAPSTADGREPLDISIVSGVKLHRLPILKDSRGSLSVAEIGRTLPFMVKRYFIVYDVADGEVRGDHAHRELHQFLVCVKGSVSVVLDDGTNREELALKAPDVGIHIGPMVWGTQYKYSGDAVLLVLASDVYKANDYIRDYEEYIALRRSVIN